jgi:ribosomal protein L32
MQQEDIRVRCTQCGDAHMESERPRRSDEEFERKNCTALVCPKCGHDVWENA